MFTRFVLRFNWSNWIVLQIPLTTLESPSTITRTLVYHPWTHSVLSSVHCTCCPISINYHYVTRDGICVVLKISNGVSLILNSASFRQHFNYPAKRTISQNQIQKIRKKYLITCFLRYSIVHLRSVKQYSENALLGNSSNRTDLTVKGNKNNSLIQVGH